MKIQRRNASGTYDIAFDSENIINANIGASANIADTKLATISTANKVSLSAVDLDGGSEIGADLVDADVVFVDDGNNGTNRKSLLSRFATYIFAKVSGEATVTSAGALTIALNAVSAGKIASNAVETAKINTGAVTNAKLSTITGEIAGAWQTFTPVIGGGTHNGTKVGRYRQVGKTVDFIITLTWATGDNFSGLVVNLPVTAQTNINTSQIQVMFGDGLTPYTGAALVGTTNMTIYAVRANQTYADAVTVSNTIPFTWGAGDTVQIAGRYEAA